MARGTPNITALSGAGVVAPGGHVHYSIPAWFKQVTGV